ncbi:MAG: hypothetical protein LUM44_07680 [Pyrinomonadaceae bacterium]|nr:hypothetical protein [Pyrinomonadaceae bacterium]
MICVNNDSRCIQTGYCSCHRDDLSEAATGIGGLFFGAVIGIFISFLYPAIKILRSEKKYEPNGLPKFSGSLWLFLSPLFGLLSNMLYQVTFALAACSAGAIQLKFTNSIYVAGTFAIYALAVGLAVSAFAFKNRKVIHLLFIMAENRTGNKIFILICAGLMGLLAAFFAAGAVVAATSTYFEFKTNIQSNIKKDNELISNEINKFDFYIGKYKFITRGDKELFVISKSTNGKNLILNMDNANSETSKNKGCILTPRLEGEAIYYSVSECSVDGKKSPLQTIYFKTDDNRIQMNFLYDIRASGDTLEKIK